MTGTIHMLVGDTILETRQYHSLKEQQLIIFAFKKMGASAVQVVPNILDWNTGIMGKQGTKDRNKTLKRRATYQQL
jgi:hypothetical protein